MIAVEAIAVHPGGVNWRSLLMWSLLRWLLLRQSLLRQSLLRWSLLRWSLLRQSLLRRSLLRHLLLRWSLFILGGLINDHCWGNCCWDDRCWGNHWRWSLLKQLLLKQLLLRGSAQNCIMSIVRCIMGNAFCSTTDLQVPSVCTSFVKCGIYWEKNKEDRLVYSFLVKLDHYCECLMWLRPTWRRNK